MLRKEPPPTAANWALFEFKRLEFPGPKTIARAQLLHPERCVCRSVEWAETPSRELISMAV